MADTGWLNPASTGESYNEWSNPSNAFASNGNYASSESGNTRDEQDYYSFSPTIPAGASINGIIVSIEGLPYAVKKPNFRVKLSYDGGSNWTATKDTGSYTSEAYKEVGGAADIWGRTWSIAEFSNANFRVHIENIGDSAVAAYPCCDHVRIKIYYSESGTVSIVGSLASSASVSGALSLTRKVAGSMANVSLISGILDATGSIVLIGSLTSSASILGILSGGLKPSSVQTKFIKLNYILSGVAYILELDISEVYQVTISPINLDDVQRKQNNLAIKYSNDISNNQISVVLEPSQDLVIETLKTISLPMTMFVYCEGVVIHSFYVQLDRESCKQFREFDLVSNDKIELNFYEVESGYSAFKYFNNGICF